MFFESSRLAPPKGETEDRNIYFEPKKNKKQQQQQQTNVSQNLRNILLPKANLAQTKKNVTRNRSV